MAANDDTPDLEWHLESAMNRFAFRFFVVSLSLLAVSAARESFAQTSHTVTQDTRKEIQQTLGARSNFGYLLGDLCRKGRLREAQSLMLAAQSNLFDQNPDRLCRISVELGDSANATKFFRLRESNPNVSKRTIETRCDADILRLLVEHTASRGEPNWLMLKASYPGEMLNVILTGEVEGATRLDFFDTAETLLKGMMVINYSQDDIRNLSSLLAREKAAQRQRLFKSASSG